MRGAQQIHIEPGWGDVCGILLHILHDDGVNYGIREDLRGKQVQGEIVSRSKRRIGIWLWRSDAKREAE